MALGDGQPLRMMLIVILEVKQTWERNKLHLVDKMLSASRLGVGVKELRLFQQHIPSPAVLKINRKRGEQVFQNPLA